MTKGPHTFREGPPLGATKLHHLVPGRVCMWCATVWYRRWCGQVLWLVSPSSKSWVAGLCASEGFGVTGGTLASPSSESWVAGLRASEGFGVAGGTLAGPSSESWVAGLHVCSERGRASGWPVVLWLVLRLSHGLLVCMYVQREGGLQASG